MSKSDLEQRLRNTISWPMTNIANYPEDVRVRLWGARLSTVIDETVKAVVEAGLISTEWEYAVEETKLEYGNGRIMDGLWSPHLEDITALKEQMEQMHQNNYVALTGKHWYSYRVVKRPKALPYVDVEEKEN